MTGKPKWVFWVRGTLLSALSGHWIANLLLDPGQYERAGLEYTWRALLPVLLQTILVLLVVVVVRRPLRTAMNTKARLRHASNLSRLLILLTTSQLVLFLLMEVSERGIQREPFADGLFASGFAFELLFAIVSALLLVAFGSVALRVIGSPRRRAMTSPIDDRIRPLPELVVPAHAALIVGGVRAPPLPPA
ncbi:MAG: hypothetical protein ACRDHS_04400 [Actinomycetota bacterium]